MGELNIMRKIIVKSLHNSIFAMCVYKEVQAKLFISIQLINFKSYIQPLWKSRKNWEPMRTELSIDPNWI